MLAPARETAPNGILTGKLTKVLRVATLDSPVAMLRLLKQAFSHTMDYLRMDGKQYASKVRNKALEDFDWLSQWLERKFLAETG